MAKRRVRIEAAADAPAQPAPEASDETAGGKPGERITVQFTGVRAVVGGVMMLHNETRVVSRNELALAEKKHPGEFEIQGEERPIETEPDKTSWAQVGSAG